MYYGRLNLNSCYNIVVFCVPLAPLLQRVRLSIANANLPVVEISVEGQHFTYSSHFQPHVSDNIYG